MESHRAQLRLEGGDELGPTGESGPASGGVGERPGEPLHAEEDLERPIEIAPVPAPESTPPRSPGRGGGCS